MDFIVELYNTIVKFVLDVLKFFGLNTDRVPGEIVIPEKDGE